MWRLLRPDTVTAFQDERVKKAIPRYIDTVEDRRLAQFQVLKKIPVTFGAEDSLNELWRLHAEGLRQFKEMIAELDARDLSVKRLRSPGSNLLDLKAEIADRLVQSCVLCERRCQANRKEGEKGVCEAAYDMEVSSFFRHMGEEPQISPSFTVFTVHCNFFCQHCQNWSISRAFEEGEVVSPGTMAALIDEARRDGNRNANLVGGDPGPWLHAWLKVFQSVKTSIPVVWNSNMYYSSEAAHLLEGFVDLFLSDYKYGNDRCAARYSKVPKYVEVVSRNHLLGARHAEFLVRVLVLPNHNSCCTRPILRWIRENLGANTLVNIMDQYRPEYLAKNYPEVNRGLRAEEFSEAVEMAREVGLENFIA